jgi:hypothetical protein
MIGLGLDDIEKRRQHYHTRPFQIEYWFEISSQKSIPPGRFLSTGKRATILILHGPVVLAHLFGLFWSQHILEISLFLFDTLSLQCFAGVASRISPLRQSCAFPWICLLFIWVDVHGM